MPPPVLAAVGVASAVLGLFFNGYILLVLVYNRQIRTANNLLLLHLGVADSLLCVQLLLSVVLQQWLGQSPDTVAVDVVDVVDQAAAQAEAPSPSQLCVTLGFAWTALLPVVVWSLAGLNCDRYCAIATPLHYSRLVDTRRVFAFAGLSWALGVALACPPLFRVNPYVYRDARGGCFADFADPHSGPWYGAVYATAALLAPTAVMVFCNARIFLIARFHRHRIASALYEITLRAQATILHRSSAGTGNPSFYLAKFKGRCAVLTVLQLLGSLVLLYFPYFGVALDEAATRRPAPDLLVTVATALATCSPPTHGFVYGVKSRVLRKTFTNFLRRQLYQSEVHTEIQRQASRRASVQSAQPTTRRGSSTNEGLPKRLLQRRMSEILNGTSPKTSTHRRLSELCPRPASSASTSPARSNGEAVESLARNAAARLSSQDVPTTTLADRDQEEVPSPPKTLEASNGDPDRRLPSPRPAQRPSAGGSVRFCTVNNKQALHQSVSV